MSNPTDIAHFSNCSDACGLIKIGCGLFRRCVAGQYHWQDPQLEQQKPVCPPGPGSQRWLPQAALTRPILLSVAQTICADGFRLEGTVVPTWPGHLPIARPHKHRPPQRRLRPIPHENCSYRVFAFSACSNASAAFLRRFCSGCCSLLLLNGYIILKE